MLGREESLVEKSGNILTGYGTGMFVSMIFTKGKKHLHIHNNPFNCDILYLHNIKECVCVCARASTHVCAALPCPTLCNPMDNTAHLALLSVEFSRQKNWNELPFPTPGFLPDPGIKPRNWQADSLPLAPSGKMVSSNICCQLHKEIVTLYCLMKIQGSKLYTVISII